MTAKRRLLACSLLVGLLAVGAWALLPHPLTVARLALAPPPRSLPVPVQGVTPEALADTRGAPPHSNNPSRRSDPGDP